jgi:hypothetical protein
MWINCYLWIFVFLASFDYNVDNIDVIHSDNIQILYVYIIYIFYVYILCILYDIYV